MYSISAGFYVDLYEKTDRKPVTSVVTGNRTIFDGLVRQLNGEAVTAETNLRDDN